MRVLADGPWQGICDFCWRRYSVQQQWVSPDERERLLKEWWATQRGRRA
ncbi:MAG: hypothetical protein J2P45_09460 [Candidatus Dormibacteraeota bacterium]|nr:hypothetical protein [Candidatus Dormibacteraeota bacterium]